MTVIIVVTLPIDLNYAFQWLDDVTTAETIDDVSVVKRLFTIIFGAKHRVLDKMYKVATGKFGLRELEITGVLNYQGYPGIVFLIIQMLGYTLVK